MADAGSTPASGSFNLMDAMDTRAKYLHEEMLFWDGKSGWQECSFEGNGEIYNPENMMWVMIGGDNFIACKRCAERLAAEGKLD